MHNPRPLLPELNVFRRKPIEILTWEHEYVLAADGTFFRKRSLVSFLRKVCSLTASNLERGRLFCAVFGVPTKHSIFLAKQIP
jgi:hypothetical protein